MELDSHVDTGQMYRVYRNQAAAAYSSLYFFSFLSLQFSNIKIFIALFLGTVRPRKLKLGTHVDSEQMYRVNRNQAAALYSSLYVFSFLSLQFSIIKIFVAFFSESVRPIKLTLDTHVDNGCIVYTAIRLLLFICPILAQLSL